MFTTPCCGQVFRIQGHRCGCGHSWDRQRMIQHDLVDEMFVFEELADLAEGNFVGAMEVAAEEIIFDDLTGF